MSAAVTSPSPLWISTVVSKSQSSESTLKITLFRLRTIVITSSTIPSTLWNSCCAPLSLKFTNAAPGRDDKRVRRRALPKVSPNPLSNGEITNYP